MNTEYDFFGEPISTYTRADALRDGVLVDVTEQAKQTGFKIPVAITSRVAEIVEPPEERTGQSWEGRLHDLLSMLFFRIRQAPDTSDLIFFKCAFTTKNCGRPRPMRFKCAMGPGDTPKPVLTIMLWGED